jgi:hypothetical protein
MEYRRAYRDEKPDEGLVARHEREIFPLMKQRALFSGSEHFRLYDFFENGHVNENVFAYSNMDLSTPSGGSLGGARSLVIYNNAYQSASGWVRVDLGQHNDGADFLILKEHRSGLSYIRSSKDVCEHGMFFMLQGYGCQVFMDIEEIHDANGNWARLNSMLAGKGVESIKEGMQELLLGELYAAYEKLITTDGADNTDLLKENAENFVEIAKKYKKGEGNYPAFPRGQSHKEIDDETIIKDYTTTLKSLESAVSSNKEFAVVRREPNNSSRPFVVNILHGFATLTLLRDVVGNGACGNGAVLLAEYWGLDKRLEKLLAQNAPALPADCLVDLMKATIRRMYLEHDELVPAPKTPAALVAQNYDAEDFRAILGVNVFDDVVWFNKEHFELALTWAPVFASPVCGAKAAKSWQAAFKKAEAASGYKLDALIEALAEEEDAPVQRKRTRTA